jgi:hypothetical protein
MRWGHISVFIVLVFTSASVADLVISDDILATTAWCYRERCFTDFTGPLAGQTNECQLDSDCYYKKFYQDVCGAMTTNPSYVTNTDIYCIPMGDLGKKYCTAGCRQYMAPYCHDNGVVRDEIYGTMNYCILYYDNITTEIVPICPCHIQNCEYDSPCGTLPTIIEDPPTVAIQSEPSTALTLDSTAYEDGRPIVFFGQTNNGVHERLILFNDQNDGLGNFTTYVSLFSGDIDNINAIKLQGANNGSLCFATTFAVCSGAVRYGWQSWTVDGITDTVTETGALACTSNPGTREGALLLRDIDDVPLALWVRGKSLYVGVNTAIDGTGAFTEYLLRAGNSITGTSNSFVQLASGGFGVYYYQRLFVSPKLVNTWEYSYTTDTTGTSGWVHQTIHTTSSNRRGVLGVDGEGYVFIAHTSGDFPQGYAQLQILRGVDSMGTSFTPVYTVTMDSSCTTIGVNRRRVIHYPDNTMGMLITCQNQRIFYLKSVGPSAASPWLIQHVITGDASFSAVDPTTLTSIGLTFGIGNPHLVYRKQTENNIQFIQSLDTLF